MLTITRRRRTLSGMGVGPDLTQSSSYSPEEREPIDSSFTPAPVAPAPAPAPTPAPPRGGGTDIDIIGSGTTGGKGPDAPLVVTPQPTGPGSIPVVVSPVQTTTYSQPVIIGTDAEQSSSYMPEDSGRDEIIAARNAEPEVVSEPTTPPPAEQLPVYTPPIPGAQPGSEVITASGPGISGETVVVANGDGQSVEVPIELYNAVADSLPEELPYLTDGMQVQSDRVYDAVYDSVEGAMPSKRKGVGLTLLLAIAAAALS